MSPTTSKSNNNDTDVTPSMCAGHLCARELSSPDLSASCYSLWIDLISEIVNYIRWFFTICVGLHVCPDEYPVPHILSGVCVTFLHTLAAFLARVC